MRRAALIGMAVALLCAPHAYAESKKPSVDPALCTALIDYKPGVDAYGKPVKPADLPSEYSLDLPKTFKIPLTLDLKKALGLDSSYDKLGAGTEIQLGEFTVEGDKVLFNGKTVTDEQQERMDVLCAGQE